MMKLFCKNSYQLLAVKYDAKKLHRGFSKCARFLIRLWSLYKMYNWFSLDDKYKISTELSYFLSHNCLQITDHSNSHISMFCGRNLIYAVLLTDVKGSGCTVNDKMDIKAGLIYILECLWSKLQLKLKQNSEKLN